MSGIMFCTGGYLAFTGSAPAFAYSGTFVSGLCSTFLPIKQSAEPERLASLVLAEIRRWLKEGNSIRAEYPEGDVLNLKSEKSVYDGLVIEGPGRRV